MNWPNIEKNLVETNTRESSVRASEVIQYWLSLLPEPSFSVDSDGDIVLTFKKDMFTAWVNILEYSLILSISRKDVIIHTCEYGSLDRKHQADAVRCMINEFFT